MYVCMYIRMHVIILTFHKVIWCAVVVGSFDAPLRRGQT